MATAAGDTGEELTVPHLRSRSVSKANPSPTNLRCPYCGRLGTFDNVDLQDVAWDQPASHGGNVQYRAGIRACPNTECRGIVFAIRHKDRVLTCYPPELHAFDPMGVPDPVRESMEEAIKCHSQSCYRAAALMVRRTLEAMCEERGATGGNLEARIKALGNKIVVPQELIEGAHELRFLGNDAAHVEAREYVKVGKDEVEAALDLTKALLTATYQQASLVARLRALKAKNAGG